MNRNTDNGRHRPALPPRPEILAPAGNLAAFAAGVEAGADAVYLGLKEFSARTLAENFSLEDLTRLVPLARERGVRVYVAFNSLLKETELPRAARLLDALTAIRPDALIMQDLGLLRLVKRHFPQFEIHASTLMAVHNQPGLTQLETLGFKRAVLARELTLPEIKALSGKSGLGLEVFIHGALCFSVSGLCLMSSFLGGKGSLRGACTQPCRRRYTSANKSGAWFSATDLDVSDLMSQIRTLKLAALKIEGRMKGAQYVSNVVRAYRLLLDASPQDMDEALNEARRLIDATPGRRSSSGFFLDSRAVEGLAPDSSATSGLFLGRIETVSKDGGRLSLRSDLDLGDRLRVQFKESGSRQAFTLKEMTLRGKKTAHAAEGDQVRLAAPFPLSAGDLVFKVDTSRGEKDALGSELAIEFRNRPIASLESGPALKKALREIKAGPVKPARAKDPEAWYRLGRAEDLLGLAGLKPDRIILPLTTRNLKRALSQRRRMGNLFEKLVWALPPLLFEPGLTKIRRDLAELEKTRGLTLMISNLGHLPLLDSLRRNTKGRKGSVHIYADYRLNCLNTQAEAALKDMGLAGVTLSLENDRDNMKEILKAPGPIPRLIYIYGRPPLFASRFSPAGLKDNQLIESPRRERFRIKTDRDTCQVFAERPIYLRSLLRMRPFNGVKAFILDLEFAPHPTRAAWEVKEALAKGRPIKGASSFNLDRRLY